MTFLIEDTDDDVDYSPTPLRREEPEVKQDMTIVINAFPDDHFLACGGGAESSCLLGDRIAGTVGFCGALALLVSTCCCCCRGCHRVEIANTYNRHTLFGLCCPLG